MASKVRASMVSAMASLPKDSELTAMAMKLLLADTDSNGMPKKENFQKFMELANNNPLLRRNMKTLQELQYAYEFADAAVGGDNPYITDMNILTDAAMRSAMWKENKTLGVTNAEFPALGTEDVWVYLVQVVTKFMIGEDVPSATLKQMVQTAFTMHFDSCSEEKQKAIGALKPVDLGQILCNLHGLVQQGREEDRKEFVSQVVEEMHDYFAKEQEKKGELSLEAQLEKKKISDSFAKALRSRRPHPSEMTEGSAKKQPVNPEDEREAKREAAIQKKLKLREERAASAAAKKTNDAEPLFDLVRTSNDRYMRREVYERIFPEVVLVEVKKREDVAQEMEPRVDKIFVFLHEDATKLPALTQGDMEWLLAKKLGRMEAMQKAVNQAKTEEKQKTAKKLGKKNALVNKSPFDASKIEQYARVTSMCHDEDIGEYLSVNGAVPGAPGATSYLLTYLVNGEKNVHTIVGPTPCFRLMALNTSKVSSVDASGKTWPDWMTYVPKEHHNLVGTDDVTLASIAAEWVPQEHPHYKSIVEFIKPTPVETETCSDFATTGRGDAKAEADLKSKGYISTDDAELIVNGKMKYPHGRKPSFYPVFEDDYDLQVITSLGKDAVECSKPRTNIGKGETAEETYANLSKQLNSEMRKYEQGLSIAEQTVSSIPVLQSEDEKSEGTLKKELAKELSEMMSEDGTTLENGMFDSLADKFKPLAADFISSTKGLTTTEQVTALIDAMRGSDDETVRAFVDEMQKLSANMQKEKERKKADEKAKKATAEINRRVKGYWRINDSSKLWCKESRAIEYNFNPRKDCKLRGFIGRYLFEDDVHNFVAAQGVLELKADVKIFVAEAGKMDGHANVLASGRTVSLHELAAHYGAGKCLSHLLRNVEWKTLPKENQSGLLQIVLCEKVAVKQINTMRALLRPEWTAARLEEAWSCSKQKATLAQPFRPLKDGKSPATLSILDVAFSRRPQHSNFECTTFRAFVITMQIMSTGEISHEILPSINLGLAIEDVMCSVVSNVDASHVMEWVLSGTPCVNIYDMMFTPLVMQHSHAWLRSLSMAANWDARRNSMQMKGVDLGIVQSWHVDLLRNLMVTRAKKCIFELCKYVVNNLKASKQQISAWWQLSMDSGDKEVIKHVTSKDPHFSTWLQLELAKINDAAQSDMYRLEHKANIAEWELIHEEKAKKESERRKAEQKLEVNQEKRLREKAIKAEREMLEKEAEEQKARDEANEAWLELETEADRLVRSALKHAKKDIEDDTITLTVKLVKAAKDKLVASESKKWELYVKTEDKTKKGLRRDLISDGLKKECKQFKEHCDAIVKGLKAPPAPPAPTEAAPKESSKKKSKRKKGREPATAATNTAAEPKESEFVRSLKTKAVDLPDDLLCPITFCPLIDAVSVVPCGHVFDKETMQGMLRVEKDQKKRYECPTCRGKIEKTLVPAYYIRQQVEEWQKANDVAEE